MSTTTRKALQLVRMATGRNEIIALVIITALIIAGQSWYLNQHGKSDQVEALHAWQISSFNSFEDADQAIYNALYTVKEEVPYIYDDINFFTQPGEKFRWPDIDDFQAYYLPPFLRDNSWEQTGSVEWSLFEPNSEGEMQGYSMYLGNNGQIENQGSFLLTIGHVHAGMTNNNALDIWWHPSNNTEMPVSGFKDILIREGWKYVVPHSGQDEVDRLYGD